MTGTWITIVLIWLIAPFVELGIIIGLVIERDRNKQRIRELEAGTGKTQSGLRERAALTAKSAAVYSSGYGVWPKPTMQADGQRENRLYENAEKESSIEHENSVENKGSIDDESSVEDENSIENKRCIEDTCSIGYTDSVEEIKRSIGYADRAREMKIKPAFNLGTAALVLGVIFIVLAGLIFGTTSWHVLADVHKVLLIFSSAAVFFGASILAERFFGIRRTSNAFYLLGSIFLFLSVLAAGYFRLFGDEFILVGRNRWRVLWVGSLVMEGAFLAGVKRFNDRIYTQSSLWGMSVSMLFMAKALQVGWKDFLSMMTLYAFGLLVLKEWVGREKKQAFWPEETVSVRGLLLREMVVFVPLHFWIFGGCTMLCAALSLLGLDEADYLGTAALLAAALGAGYAAREKKSSGLSLVFSLSVAEFFWYAASLVPASFAVQLGLAAAADGGWFLLGRRLRGRKQAETLLPDSRVLDCTELEDSICTAALVVKTFLLFSPLHVLWSGWHLNYRLEEWAAASVVVLVLAVVTAQWGRKNRKLRVLLPIILGLLTVSADQSIKLLWADSRIAYAAILLVFLVLAALWDSWKKDYFWPYILFVGMAAQLYYFCDGGKDNWWFFYTVFVAVYLLFVRKAEQWKKPAFSLSACFFAMAFWGQPFVCWPDWIELEFALLPAAGLLWAAGKIWGERPWIKLLQRIGYLVCLGILALDACCGGLLVDALITEGCWLAAFIWGQVKKDVWWVRISGIMLLLIVLFMTKDFWLSISWWVYLLAAGIGLILFAAVNEKRKR